MTTKSYPFTLLQVTVLTPSTLEGLQPKALNQRSPKTYWMEKLCSNLLNIILSLPLYIYIYIMLASWLDFCDYIGLRNR